MKRCSRCRRLKPLDEFWPDRRCKRDGRAGKCKPCHVIVNREWRNRNRERVRAYDRARTRDGRNAATAKRWRDRLKAAVIEAYGGGCGCCGETHPAFLSLDHIDGQIPASHRHRSGKRIAGAKLYKLVLDEGCPPTYRILCFNCNYAIGLLGHCPHEIALREAV